MSIQLHNKYEVITGGNTYTADAKMVVGILDKLKNFEPYNGYFAFGTGTTDVDYYDTTLGTYVASYATTTESIQPNVLNGEMKVVKKVVLGANDASGLAFSEIGLTDVSTSNPTIYNRVVFKDSNDQPITITKVAGQEMTIKLTISLEMSENTKFQLVAGDNKLVKQLLGENVLTSTSFVITKGTDTSPNTPIYRQAPSSYTAMNYETVQYNLYRHAGFTNEYCCDFGQGEVIEILMMLDGQPVLRYNCSNDNISFSQSKYVEVTIYFKINGFNPVETNQAQGGE